MLDFRVLSAADVEAIIAPSAIFIRGLYEAFSRNPRNAKLRVLLRSYVDVQVRIDTLYIFGYRPNRRSSTTLFSTLRRRSQPIPRVGTGLLRHLPLGDSLHRCISIRAF